METININLENLTKEERDRLLSLVEKSNKKKIFKPKKGETFYCVTETGWITSKVYNGYEDHQDMINNGNCYKTLDAVENAAVREPLVRQMERFAYQCGSTKELMFTKCDKYCIGYDYTSKKLTILHHLNEVGNNIYFTKAKYVQECIEEFGENNIKKYYLRVIDR